jgi:carboxypeptidase Taq
MAVSADPAAVPDAATRLLALWADIAALDRASSMLQWDQETYMPPKGQAGRGQVLAALAGLHHEKLTAPELTEAIEAAAAEAEPGSDLEAQVREARRAVVRATAVPEDLTRRIAEVESRALASWQEARTEADFSLFQPDLTETITLQKEVADAYVAAGIADNRYDALLDAYEPGMTEAQLTPLLGDLRAQLAPLIAAAADSGVVVDESCAKGSFPADDQLAFGRMVSAAIGYDFDAGRIDETAHPFSITLAPGDSRITWRWEDDDFRPGLFGIMHETGHAMYEQGLPEAWAGTPMGGAVSLGVHESQSRLWENLVGRSRSFWEWALPRFHETFPATRDVTLDQLWPALHTVTPSLIRVEADEATYNLHIVARYEIERAIMADEVAGGDLPELWDDTYEQLLGIRAPSVADGVLQDIHWSMGAFGYFPTYTLGNLINAQLFAAARADLGDLDEQFRRGEFAPLLQWLRENVHRHASRYPAPDLVERATDAPLSSEHFLTYIRSVTNEVYGLTA